MLCVRAYVNKFIDKKELEVKKKYFGTDGIRGRVGSSPINPEFILRLGWALGKVLVQQKGNHTVLIGKDTRISGYMLESVLEAGLSAAGVNILLCGPMPTPAIAYLTRTLRVQAGIVITASHNLFEDNGIKIFSSEGTKLSDDLELAIEEKLEESLITVNSASLGKASRLHDAAGRYIEFCKSHVPPNYTLSNMKIVVDCAHGATYHIAPNVYRELGAEVIEIGAKPNGLNINQGYGSTHPEVLQQRVMDEKADLGIALDGDGDRVLMVDHLGNLVDGDELLYLMVKNRLARSRPLLGVVGTQMSNIALELALKEVNIDFYRAKVGDRYVMQALKERDWVLGGEPSGHLVSLDLTTTGDGIIASLQVLRSLIREKVSLFEAKQDFTKFPQFLFNVTLPKPQPELLEIADIQNEIHFVERELGNNGRILVRISGTEPVVRVMTEGKDPKITKEMAERVVAKINATINTIA
jgi:phosphoglucosamine mutase